MTENYKLILFDFDYTLVDSSKAVEECINYALSSMGIEKVSSEVACKTIGLALSIVYKDLTGDDDIDKSNEFVRLFAKKADEVMVSLTCAYDSVLSTMKYLKEKGLKLGIVSNKHRHRIEAILEKEGLANIFDIVIGSEDMTKHKPDPEGVIKAADSLGIPQEDIIYVGDSLVDAQTVKGLKVSFVATLTGTTTKEEFKEYRALGIIKDISELIDLIK